MTETRRSLNGLSNLSAINILNPPKSLTTAYAENAESTYFVSLRPQRSLRLTHLFERPGRLASGLAPVARPVLLLLGELGHRPAELREQEHRVVSEAVFTPRYPYDAAGADAGVTVTASATGVSAAPPPPQAPVIKASDRKIKAAKGALILEVSILLTMVRFAGLVKS